MADYLAEHHTIGRANDECATGDPPFDNPRPGLPKICFGTDNSVAGPPGLEQDLRIVEQQIEVYRKKRQEALEALVLLEMGRLRHFDTGVEGRLDRETTE